MLLTKETKPKCNANEGNISHANMNKWKKGLHSWTKWIDVTSSEVQDELMMFVYENLLSQLQHYTVVNKTREIDWKIWIVT